MKIIDISLHKILLDAGVILLEGINLFGVEAREYELICMPLKLTGAEGAPARAVLRILD
jgi:arylformamidase